MLKISKEIGLCLISSKKLSQGRSNKEVVKAALAGGVDMIQLREKDLSCRRLIKEGRELLELTRKAGIPFIINDRVDVALAVGADGVHLGQQDMPLREARAILGPEKIIGVSTHNLKEALAAECDGADYVGFGAVFPTSTKKDIYLNDLKKLGEIIQKVSIPVMAIGGIKLDRVRLLRGIGARNIAVISDIVTAEDITQTVRRFKQLLL